MTRLAASVRRVARLTAPVRRVARRTAVRRTAAVVVLVVLAGVAIYLPFRPEWSFYRKAVPATRVRTVAAGRSGVYEGFRWKVLGYGPAVLHKGDLPPSGLTLPARTGETLVTVELDQETLRKGAFDIAGIDYSFADGAGHTWTAAKWHENLYKAVEPHPDDFTGSRETMYVMGTVPAWAVGRFYLVMRRQHADLTPPLGGPVMIFRR